MTGPSLFWLKSSSVKPGAYISLSLRAMGTMLPLCRSASKAGLSPLCGKLAVSSGQRAEMVVFTLLFKLEPDRYGVLGTDADIKVKKNRFMS